MNLLQQKLAYAHANRTPQKRTSPIATPALSITRSYTEFANPEGPYECLKGHTLDARLQCAVCDR